MIKSLRHKELEWCHKQWKFCGLFLLILTFYMIYEVGFFDTNSIIMYGIFCLWYCLGALLSFIDVLSRDENLADNLEVNYQKKSSKL
jgi:hypothetical protein